MISIPEMQIFIARVFQDHKFIRPKRVQPELVSLSFTHKNARVEKMLSSDQLNLIILYTF